MPFLVPLGNEIMNIFLLKNLTVSELLLFYNCIREILEAFEAEGEFQARIGVSREFGREMRDRLGAELDKRPEESRR